MLTLPNSGLPDCFNPRTRVGCDPCPAITLPSRPRVSIHAPAWGATAGCRHHLPAGPSFNPRTRVGCDPCPVPRAAGDACVSIHAPAWGATSVHGGRADGRVGFNPRTRVGCDYQGQRYGGCAATFQSTHPRGVRHATFGRAMPNGDVFQSTHPRGVRRACGHQRRC